VEVVLVRHGRPVPIADRLVSGRELGEWLTRFNKAGLADAVVPPATQALVKSARCVLASDVVRSIESARVLGSDPRIEPDLREAVLPSSIGVSLRLPPSVWIVIARAAWWLNWCRSEEPIAAARVRARRAADRLCTLARQHGTIAVIGHGVFNRFIAEQLLTRGWRGPRFLANAHWSASRFTHD
jgi:broad specificity phosphatase PhoE